MKAYKCTQHCLGCPSGASHSHNIIHNSVCTQKILFSSSSIFLFLQEMSLNVLLRSIDRWAGGSSSTVPQSVRYHKLLLPRALDVCNRPGQAKWRAGSHVYVWYETFLMSFCNPTTSLWRQTLFVNKTWPVRCALWGWCVATKPIFQPLNSNFPLWLEKETAWKNCCRIFGRFQKALAFEHSVSIPFFPQWKRWWTGIIVSFSPFNILIYKIFSNCLYL